MRLSWLVVVFGLLETMSAAVLPPKVETIDPFLSTPVAGALYQIPVVIIRYFPTNDGVNMDQTLTGVNSTIAAQAQSIDAHTIQTKFMLEQGSRFRGYANPQAPPSLGYRVVQIISVYEDLPLGLPVPNATNQFYPDYDQILSRFGGQQLVEQQGVKEFWLYMYQATPSITGKIVPNESTMASPTTGNISNSYRFKDMPVYNRTYTLYGYNFTRTAAENVHDHGHQIEALLGYANQKQDGNTNLFWQQFVGENGQGQHITGRVGWTHMPPNTTVDYDWFNTTLVSSDIADWQPAGTGVHQLVNVSTWESIKYTWPYGVPPEQNDPYWYLYYFQNMAGLGNQIPVNGKRMTNWWQFTADWDTANKAGLGLYDDPASYSVAPTSQTSGVTGGNVSVNVSGTGGTWIASSNSTWIHIVSQPYGRGGATVQLQVDSNPGSQRQGTVAIAGQLLTITQAGTAAPLPVITSVTTANGGTDIAQNTWIVIKGTNLASPSTPSSGAIWSNAPEFASGKMPTQLDAVSVTVNGKAAYVYFVCSAATDPDCASDQVNALTPLDSTLGPVQIVLTNGGNASAPYTANLQSSAPSFLLFGASNYIAATHADSSLVGPSTLYPGLSTPAKPGETVILYGVGFGLPTSILVNGSASQSGSLPTKPVILIGEPEALVSFAGVISPGLYQFNITIPSTAINGDSSVTARYGGFTTSGSKQLTITASGGGTGTPPLISSFSAIPNTINTNSLDASSLNWNTANATSVSIDNGVGSVSPAAVGARFVHPSSTTTYTLTATNANGASVSKTATVVVAGPLSFMASPNPTTVCNGNGLGQITITWNVPQRTATPMRGANALAPAASTGSVTLNDVQNGELFQLTVQNATIAQLNAAVTCAPTPKILTLNAPSYVASGDSLDVQYSVSGATSVVLQTSGGQILASSSQLSGTLSTVIQQGGTYVLLAKNGAVVDSRSFTIQSGAQICASYKTPVFDGRALPISFHNDGNVPVNVRLYYPTDPTRPYGGTVYTIAAGANQYLIAPPVGVGSDWGIRVGDFCPVSVGTSALYYVGSNWQEAGNAVQGLTTHGGNGH